MHGVIEVSDSGFSQHWHTLYANDPVQNPLYMQQAGQHLGIAAGESYFTDRSFLVMSEDEPIFGCSLTMHIDDQGRNCMGYFGLEASTHVNRSTLLETSNNFQPGATRLLQEHIYKLIEEIQPRSVEYLDPVSCGIMSPVTQVLLLKGGKPVVQQTQLIDLSQSQRVLYRDVAKNCRSAIEWGRRNLELEIQSARSFEKLKLNYSDNMQLSTSLASTKFDIPGRLAYEKLIQQGNGFLIQASYKNKLVASSLFVHTDRVCHFIFTDVLAESPDQPVLHALIWEAILYSKEINCSQFDLGRYPILESREPSGFESKLIAGSFGGESHTRLVVTLDR